MGPSIRAMSNAECRHLQVKWRILDVLQDGVRPELIYSPTARAVNITSPLFQVCIPATDLKEMDSAESSIFW